MPPAKSGSPIWGSRWQLIPFRHPAVLRVCGRPGFRVLTPQGASSPGSGSSWKSPLVRTPPAPAATAPSSLRQRSPGKGSFREVTSAAGHDARAEPARGAGGRRGSPRHGLCCIWGTARPGARLGGSAVGTGGRGESGAGAGRGPPEPPLFPWGSRPSLPPRSIYLSPAPAADQCPRGQGRAQGCPRWMQSLGWAPENSGKQPRSDDPAHSCGAATHPPRPSSHRHRRRGSCYKSH